jgi:hypothetical protein
MLRVHLQKLGSLLGLLAILMSTLAPTVSQVLVSDHLLGDALTTYCSESSGADASMHDGKPAHSDALHWQACAYCGLLAHVPTLPSVAIAFASLLLIVRAPLPDAPAGVPARFAHTAAQPRAPPVFS